ncbi:MAG: rhomboid family intramembrane serine protease [Desulfuromonadia bacterium]
MTAPEGYRLIASCRTTTPRRVARLETLRLLFEAKGIPYELVRRDESLQLMVPEEEFSRAWQEIGMLDAENRNWPPPPLPPRPVVGSTLATLSVLGIIAIFNNLTHLDLLSRTRESWLETGVMKVHLLRYGELWRSVTALTLHADVVHLLGNLSFGGVVMTLLGREYGGGVAWLLTLLSGVLGNLLNAWFQLPTHQSLGSSTALFGAVGIQGAATLVRHRLDRRKRWTMPLLGGVALLVVMGTEGERTDLGAHLFGFLSGVLLGLAAESVVSRRGTPPRWVSILSAVAAWLTVIIGWWWGISRNP